MLIESEFVSLSISICGSRRQKAYVLLGPGFIVPLGNWAAFCHLPAAPCHHLLNSQPAILASCLLCDLVGEKGIRQSM